MDADQLWREWQVAQKARQLAADIYSEDYPSSLPGTKSHSLSQEIDEVKKAIAVGNLTVAAQAPLATAQAGAENAFVTLRLNRLKSWQTLDGLLGLDPKVRFRIARPYIGPLPANVEVSLPICPSGGQT